MSHHIRAASTFVIGLTALLGGCRDVGDHPSATEAVLPVTSLLPEDASYTFAPPVYDIAASPDGSLLVGENTTVKEIRGGSVRTVGEIPTVEGSTINGLATVGRGDFFVTSAGLDLAVGAGVWQVTRGGARLLGDVEAFESAHDPDALAGPRWKDVRCEALAGFGAGPQSNPYHLTPLVGRLVLVGDAAGNTLLSVRSGGIVDWVAVFTPPVDESGAWQAFGSLDDGTPCYVQPVPTSVAVGFDGAYYVGELSGVPAVPGWSRVWRIESGAHHVVCPSDDCRAVVSGLTSVIDVAFGPDGDLYVVEYDTAGWLAALGGGGAGGAVLRCDVDTGVCDTVADGLELPGAIAFDKWGRLWLLESNIVAPTVRRLDLP